MRTFVLVAAAALATIPAALSAQVPWDTPRLVGPDSPGGLGLYWLRSSAIGPDVDAAMGTLALPGMGGSVTLRGGAGIETVEDGADNVSVFGGLDLRAPIARHTDEMPLDIEWNAGIGAGSRTTDVDYVVVSLPMAVSAGRSWSSGAIWLAPYVSVGAALDFSFGDDAPDEEFEVSPSAGVGLDFALDPGRSFVFRVATSLGDRQAFVLGLALGGA